MIELAPLQYRLEEHFNPGAPVELILGLPRGLDEAELATLDKELKRGGLQMLGAPEIGLTPEWPNALRLQFRRPHRPQGVAVLPLAALLVLALGAVGIGSVLGWKVGEVVGEMKNLIIPLALITAATFILMAYVRREG